MHPPSSTVARPSYAELIEAIHELGKQQAEQFEAQHLLLVATQHDVFEGRKAQQRADAELAKFQSVVVTRLRVDAANHAALVADVADVKAEQKLQSDRIRKVVVAVRAFMARNTARAAGGAAGGTAALGTMPIWGPHAAKWIGDFVELLSKIGG